MMRKIIDALLLPGRKLRLDDPAANRARKEDDNRSPLLTIPSEMGRTFLWIFLTLSLLGAAAVTTQTIQGRDPEIPVTSYHLMELAITTVNQLSRMTPGITVLALLLTYPVSIAGALIMGIYNRVFNTVDRVLGGDALVKRATQEGEAAGYRRGKAEGKAEGITRRHRPRTRTLAPPGTPRPRRTRRLTASSPSHPACFPGRPFASAGFPSSPAPMPPLHHRRSWITPSIPHQPKAAKNLQSFQLP